MGMCDTSEVTVSRSMPAVMEGRMNNFAWISFCDKMDEALEPVAKAKKIMVSVSSWLGRLCVYA